MIIYWALSRYGHAFIPHGPSSNARLLLLPCPFPPISNATRRVPSELYDPYDPLYDEVLAPLVACGASTIF